VNLLRMLTEMFFSRTPVPVEEHPLDARDAQVDATIEAAHAAADRRQRNHDRLAMLRAQRRVLSRTRGGSDP
jgi:hypothetical protein